MGRRPRRLQRGGLDQRVPRRLGSGPGDAVALSSTGTGCVGVYGYHVGAGATWDFDFDAFTGIPPYRAVARAAAVSEPDDRSPAGLPSAAWEVTADGGPTA